jgi:molybdopterin biosynthesis enzyme MoaB
MKKMEKVIREIRVAETGDLGNLLVDVLENSGLTVAHVSDISQEMKTASHQLVKAIRRYKAESELTWHVPSWHPG